MKYFLKTCLAAIFAAGMAGAASAASLTATEWRPVKIGDMELSDVKPFIRFDEGGKVAGDSGCNRFGGGYTLDGDAITFSSLFSTRMACPEEIMEVEQKFLQALERSRRFERDGTRLVLFDDGGEFLAEFIERH